MPDQAQKDNASFPEKVRLRKRALKLLRGETPVVLEGYAGWGRLNRACYGEVAQGVLLDKHGGKADILSQLRPTWGVFEGDTEYMLREGIGSQWEVNYLDLDPYGEPWPALAAFFASVRPWPQRLVLAVHDGVYNKLMIGAAWHIKSLASMIDKYGNRGVTEHYLDTIIPELVAEHAGVAGYTIVADTYWGAFGGYNKQSIHWMAALER